MLDILNVTFPTSGITANILLPPIVSFIISFFCSMGGITGAVLILPFQVSVLGFTSPAVSSTNLVFNIFSTPAGIYRYIKEKRMLWPLVAIVTIGTLPGLLIGYYLRVKYLPEPHKFKIFVGAVIFYLGLKLIKSAFQKKAAAKTGAFLVENVRFSAKTVEYDFFSTHYSFSAPLMFTLAFIVGIIGAAYGIGGGAIIAPFCVVLFNLPVFTVAGATLLSTFIASVFGVIFYSAIPIQGVIWHPDWLLGITFSVGGVAGMYFGAKCQKRFSEKWIKIIVSIIFILIGIVYLYKNLMLMVK
ncbi:membrane protein containing DUF81 [Candidatus Magnetoovum chiemensis]|nr:membrane protein containing DUF81 [Candidatus Magnetoovum chiemensis]